MLKMLTYIIAFYLAYRYFIKPALLPAAEKADSKPKVKAKKQEETESDDGEYIDYEEVD